MIVFAVAVMISALFFLLWIGYTAQIVRGSTLAYHYMSYAWNWIPFAKVQTYNAGLDVELRNAYALGAESNFFVWMSLSSKAFFPFSMLLVVASVVLVVTNYRRPRTAFKRKLGPDALMMEMMNVFSGIAPVVKLNLLTSNHPKWLPQRWAEEIVKDQSLARDGEVVAERARRYYVLTLGRRLIDINEVVTGKFDANKSNAMDRLSPAGKAVFAILCAFCFGGQEGRKEARALIDELNYSAFGTKDGEANLSLAQAIYSKYRRNEKAISILRVHHYENTFLFDLFRRAKRWGKITTNQFRWLKPMDRFKYLALNSVGRDVPHPEAAGVFNLYQFEKECFKSKRIPRAVDFDPARERFPIEGAPYVEDAVRALQAEYARYLRCTDTGNEDAWWHNKDLWKISNPALVAQLQQMDAAKPDAPVGEETEFDRDMAEQDVAAKKRRDAAIQREITAAEAGEM